MKDSFNSRSVLSVGERKYQIFRLDALERQGIDVLRLSYSLRVLLENLLRKEDGITVLPEDIEALAKWKPQKSPYREIAFTPARTILQDFTGVPVLVDLAAMRDALARCGGNPSKVNPQHPVELVIDHSIQVDSFGTLNAFERNIELDYQRNAERYAFLRWGQQAFQNFKVVPPNKGIIHQINLEYLARVVFSTDEDPSLTEKIPFAYPDTCVGTDSHTPMVNGLGVLAWGVGGIEAEAAMLGQPISMLIPEVVGLKLVGALQEGVTSTDLVLTITEKLRKKGVVGKFVEFYGPGIASLTLADRATIGNMSPEYGATCSIFPPDEMTLQYLRFTGRSEERIALVEAYMKEQGLFHYKNSPDPLFTDTLRIDLNSIEPCIAGPKRPQDRIPLAKVRQVFSKSLSKYHANLNSNSSPHDQVEVPGQGSGAAEASREATEEAFNQKQHRIENGCLQNGSIVIAALTSCTNTSNPSVMIAAGLLAKKASEYGLTRKPWVKTSLAPGSQVVTHYFEKAGLTKYLDELGFNLVGYGCTTCIGNSGPLPLEILKQIQERDLIVAAVLSGNRNFEGRINSDVRANFLMSPPLVVAFALVGTMQWDPYTEPVGTDKEGKPVFLKDIWPTQREIEETVRASMDADMYKKSYKNIFEGDERWKGMPLLEGDCFAWNESSTYIRQPPYFQNISKKITQSAEDVFGARAIAVVGDSITTDHISPAGSIQKDSPAGEYLMSQGVESVDFNSYGSRRGNHQVMVRGTFANVRFCNYLIPEIEGGYTVYFPTKQIDSIYNAAVLYQRDGTALCILAGKEYGSGSSRDWAAKGPQLQGIKFVIAESYERIHRSNLIGVGILPLQFLPDQSVKKLQLSGEEVFDVTGLKELIDSGFAHTRNVTVRATNADGVVKMFQALVRLDTPQEVLYYLNGGILQYVLRQLMEGKEKADVVSSASSATAQRYRGTPPSDHVVQEGSEASFPASDPPAY